MTMSPAGGSPAAVPLDVCNPEPRIVLEKGRTLRIKDAEVVQILSRMLGCRSLKKTARASIGRRRYKEWPGAVVAFNRNKVAVAAAQFTVVHVMPLGGRMVRCELPGNSIKTIDVGGAGLRISINVWTNGMCGPIRTVNPAAELAESQFGQLAISNTQVWCAPLSQTGKLVCKRCGRRFITEGQLWAHGEVPSDVQKLSLRLPRVALFRGPPPRRLDQGSIANPMAAANAERLIHKLAQSRARR